MIDLWLILRVYDISYVLKIFTKDVDYQCICIIGRCSTPHAETILTTVKQTKTRPTWCGQWDIKLIPQMLWVPTKFRRRAKKNTNSETGVSTGKAAIGNENVVVLRIARCDIV